jgi:hypothetical protein
VRARSIVSGIAAVGFLLEGFRDPSFTDTCINNVLYFLPEAPLETERKWRGIGTTSLACLGTLEERMHAGGSGATGGRGSPQRPTLEGGRSPGR